MLTADADVRLAGELKFLGYSFDFPHAGVLIRRLERSRYPGGVGQEAVYDSDVDPATHAVRDTFLGREGEEVWRESETPSTDVTW